MNWAGSVERESHRGCGGLVAEGWITERDGMVGANYGTEWRGLGLITKRNDRRGEEETNTHQDRRVGNPPAG